MVVEHLPGAHDLQRFYCCGICEANIRVRMVTGELRALCNGSDVHDINETRDVIRKSRRDLRHRQQEADADEVIAGLPIELQAVLKGD